MKSKVLRGLCVVVLLFSIILSGCSSSGPQGTVNKFIAAYNKADIDGIINCMEPKQAQQVRASINIAKGLGYDTNQLLSNIIPVGAGVDGGNGQVKMSISINDVKTNGDKAVVAGKIKVTLGAKSDEKACMFEMIRVDGKWYIANMK